MPALPPVAPAIARGRLSFEDIASRPQWEALFARAAVTHMPQAWAFGEAKRAEGWRPRRLLIRADGEPVAICQLLTRRIAGLPLVVRLNQGPLLLAGYEELAAPVHRALRRRWRFLRRGLMLLAPAIEHDDAEVRRFLSLGFRRRGKFCWMSSRLDLTRSEGQLRAALTHNWRNRLNQSEHHGLRCFAESTPVAREWILERQMEHVARKGFQGPSPALVRGLYRAAPEDCLVFRVFDGNEPVAGMLVFRFGATAHAYLAWNGPRGRVLNAGNFLFWHVALALKGMGCREFDLGGYNDRHGFGAFKQGMNGREYRLLGEFACF